MNLETLLRAAQILRAQPACTMPLARLHARLRAEFGVLAGTYGEMYDALKQRPQSFVLFDAPRLLASSHHWPAELREHYDHALNTVGLGACVRVALTEHSRGMDDGPLALAGTTLGDLWRCFEHDATMRDYLDAAARQLEQLNALIPADAATARPTTPAPDPPPAP